MIHITINNIPLEVNPETTILVAARQLNITIPTLCDLPMHAAHQRNHNSSCRVCVVEIKGRRNLAASCSTFCEEGMEILTNTTRVINARRTIIELLISDHPLDCPICDKNGHCKLQSLATKFGISELPYKGAISRPDIPLRSVAIKRNTSKCILCGACITVCEKVQTVGVLGTSGRGFSTTVGPAFNRSLDNTACTYCGQCVNVCPTGALTQTSDAWEVCKDLGNPNLHVVCQVAPAVRVALGEEFGYEPGTVVTGKMIKALKTLGFAKVFDTNFAADLTIFEEAHEFLERLENKKNLPILTSCCPGWINFIEHQFPELIDIPSSAKSPHEMFGSIIKSYYAEKYDLDPTNIRVVSIMPCLAKKYEAKRQELKQGKLPDVDYVVTTRELALMIKETGLGFKNLPDAEFDSPLGNSTGAADIFGASGGVIEAALRTASYWLTKDENLKIEFEELRGLTGIKTAEVEIAGTKLRIGVASGLGNARILLEDIKNGVQHFDALEIMACPGGCVNGGGQPLHKRKMSNTIIKQRINGLYSIDRSKQVRISALNPDIQLLYKDYLGEIGGPRAHELLHTTFFDKKKDE